MEQRKFRTIDLFCGAGGFSTGFEMTGKYEIVAGVDFKVFMEHSFINNHENANFFHYDIRNTVPKEILNLEIDLLIGSPPCQGFSDARGTRYRLDEKNDLVLHYFKWLKEINPPVAIMENVKGMTTIGSAWVSIDDPKHKQEMDFMEYLRKIANDLDYNFYYKVLKSQYFSVPQERERVFCVMTKKNLSIKPSLPIPPGHDIENKGKTKDLTKFFNKEEKNSNKENLSSESLGLQRKTNLEEALIGLPEPSVYQNGIKMSSVPPVNFIDRPSENICQKLIFDSETIHNHIARYPTEDQIQIINKIPEGLAYRSDRRGGKHIGVWDLFKEQLTKDERDALLEISKLRTRNNVKTKKGKHSEGFVPYKEHLDNRFSKVLLDGLVEKGLLQKSLYCNFSEEIMNKLCEDNGNPNNLQLKQKNDRNIIKKIQTLSKEPEYNEERGGVPFYRIGIQWNTLKRLKKENIIITKTYSNEYDLTSKSGLRGKYSRLNSKGQSRTLMTAFTNISEILHPKEDRGLSLREGARIMSFPDSFKFYGTFSQISLQIGNAVAPLVAYSIANHVYDNMFTKIL